MKKIFIDMDNVLALFSYRGMEDVALEKMTEKGYFETLPVMPYANKQLKKIQERYTLIVISACPTEEVVGEKAEWLEGNFEGIFDEAIFCKVGDNKAEILSNLGHEIEGAILIDDYSKNLSQWENYGGIAVKKRSSQKTCSRPTLRDWRELEELLKKLEY